jgi:hypothetical protein
LKPITCNAARTHQGNIAKMRAGAGCAFGKRTACAWRACLAARARRCRGGRLHGTRLASATARAGWTRNKRLARAWQAPLAAKRRSRAWQAPNLRLARAWQAWQAQHLRLVCAWQAPPHNKRRSCTKQAPVFRRACARCARNMRAAPQAVHKRCMAATRAASKRSTCAQCAEKTRFSLVFAKHAPNARLSCGNFPRRAILFVTGQIYIEPVLIKGACLAGWVWCACAIHAHMWRHAARGNMWEHVPGHGDMFSHGPCEIPRDHMGAHATCPNM